MEATLVVMKRVWITHGLIDFKEELEHTSVLLEEVWDKAVVVSEQAGQWMHVFRIWTAGCEI